MSNETLNKAITSCFAKIARVDGSIGNEEMDIINSSEILKKYKFGSIDNIEQKISLIRYSLSTVISLEKT
ncbi:MAG: hypothetical protein Ct9H90mP3_5020 [Flammeovirgaceae bacterium]|nr:MAG: hypothetical protein Ct9H90mP3_5020 [Flammeovirgaceae bacterium]